MSRGPGRIQQVVLALIEAEPDGAWTTSDICGQVYRSANRIEKKHRVAVARGLRTITLPENWWIVKLGRPGSEHLLYNRLSLESQITKRWQSTYYMHSRESFVRGWTFQVDKAREDVEEYRRYFDADELGRIDITIEYRRKALSLMRAFGTADSSAWVRGIADEITTLSARKTELQQHFDRGSEA